MPQDVALFYETKANDRLLTIRPCMLPKAGAARSDEKRSHDKNQKKRGRDIMTHLHNLLSSSVARVQETWACMCPWPAGCTVWCTCLVVL